MFAITVTEKGGEQRQIDFDKGQVTIGRVQGNDVILPKGNVSKRHARIVVKDGKFILVDLKSTNGTYVNGRKITSPLVVSKRVTRSTSETLFSVLTTARRLRRQRRSQVHRPLRRRHRPISHAQRLQPLVRH